MYGARKPPYSVAGKIQSIILTNALGPLHTPNGSTRNSKDPNGVRNAVLGVSFGSNSIWWYPDLKSSFEKTLAVFKRSKSSSMSGSGMHP